MRVMGALRALGPMESAGGQRKWKFLKMVIGNHWAPITRITPRFFCPMVASVTKVNEINIVPSVAYELFRLVSYG
jgi:hypothetical protein